MLIIYMCIYCLLSVWLRTLSSLIDWTRGDFYIKEHWAQTANHAFVVQTEMRCTCVWLPVDGIISPNQDLGPPHLWHPPWCGNFMPNLINKSCPLFRVLTLTELERRPPQSLLTSGVDAVAGDALSFKAAVSEADKVQSALHHQSYRKISKYRNPTN